MDVLIWTFTAIRPTPRRWAAAADLAERYPAAQRIEDPVATAGIARALFAGGAATLHLVGTNHQVKVWQGLLAIPPGVVTTYQALAHRLGQGREGARAVAGAVAANPVAFLIPCHRVIRKTGALGGYYYGLTRKRAMLAWEAGHAAAAASLPRRASG
ncbi:MAG: methylated-DNA--[protein]-cysteine S-methyltransferase [Alphaproteobacteria bacterium]|nr:methylated-DNA--[protein]-cysteine S-methyltransferase [Alphaproteobacteria bacterium]